MVVKSHHLQAPTFQPGGSLLITKLSSHVRFTVNFHGQASVHAEEIENEWAISVLTAEFESGKSTAAQLRPETLLGGGQALAQIAGTLLQRPLAPVGPVLAMFHEFSSTQAPDQPTPSPPTPLPQGGEGRICRYGPLRSTVGIAQSPTRHTVRSASIVTYGDLVPERMAESVLAGPDTCPACRRS